MRAGRLDRRITLKRKTETPDSLGQPQITWSDVATVWARWIPAKGQQMWTAKQFVDTAVGEFEIRYRSDITPVDQIEHDGIQYDILGQPLEIGRREGWRIPVSQRVE